LTKFLFVSSYIEIVMTTRNVLVSINSCVQYVIKNYSRDVLTITKIPVTTHITFISYQLPYMFNMITEPVQMLTHANNVTIYNTGLLSACHYQKHIIDTLSFSLRETI
jgi:hypothetical protein